LNFTLESAPGGIDLVVTGDWSPAARSQLVEGSADGLVLNYARGFRERDLTFLAGLPVRRLHVLARTIKDLSPVYSLADKLESLQVQTDARALIELERLPSLRTLAAAWQQVERSIQSAPGLQQLFLLGYTAADLTPLAELPSLRSVILKDQPQVTSLDGIEGLPRLEELGVHAAKHLADIEALGRTRAALITLQMSSCRKIPDIAPVANCQRLRFFELSEGGQVPTVAPLAGMHELERLYLYGSTNVLDGDLTPIARLPRLKDFRMQSRRTYTPTVKAIQDSIAARG
jgi:internalin A